MKKIYETPKMENISFVTEAITDIKLPEDNLSGMSSRSTDDRI